MVALRQTLLNPSSCSEFSAFVAVKGDTLESNVQFWLEVQKFKVRYMHVFCIINWTFRSRDKWRNVPPFLSVLRGLKQRRFWVTHVTRKWAFFSFNMPWRYQICIAKCFYFHRDDLTKHLFKITAQECKKSTSGWPASLKNVAEYSFSFWQLISRLVSDNTCVNVTSCIVWLPAQLAQLFNSLNK